MTEIDPIIRRPMGARRFGRINWLGLWTLAQREISRFMSVWQQTVFAPLMTAGLFVVVFSIALGRGDREIMGLPYIAFLGPGILMMTVIQNSFANTSSSMISSKMQGNIIDTLMPPLSAGEILTGYLIGAVARAALVALVIGIGMMVMIGQLPQHPLVAAVFIGLGALLMGGLGLIGGIMAQKFDQMAALTNFVVTPLSFLSGTFYSIQALPPFFRAISHANPIFYLIDGARYGFTGVSDSSPVLGFAICLFSVLLVCGTCLYLLRSGYRMKP
ncbi:ABC transporter permease [Paracoccus sp. SCSIO 75233]|uniref:ABC transporter permease n=1 Tax=Paracoccus sp. SCSIO 75233 TaxID=3017782 RepID=UPI0022EFEC23|nr:ABC transporter permease [Paracoccus sp. SCSIO 75233]WBU53162.1 ABC transporter permease [Paracoccus sp. SCSIO 75233]